VPSLPPAAESRALERAAVLGYTQGELERARIGLNRVLELAHAGDTDTIVRARICPRVSNTRSTTFASRMIPVQRRACLCSAPT